MISCCKTEMDAQKINAANSVLDPQNNVTKISAKNFKNLI